MSPIRIELLGRLRFIVGQQPLTSVSTNRLQSLLAFLVLHGDAAQSREHLAFRLWPGSSESQARTNLRQLLHHLRRALPVECSLLTTDNLTVRWRLDSSCSLDVTDFEAAALRAADAHKEGNLLMAREALEEAARLYQDDLLPDLYDEWLQTKREQLRQQYAEVLTRLTALLETAGDFPAAIRHATRLVAVDSLRETSYQLLMRLHSSNNDRSSALRVYHQCMRTLKRELGISPAIETQELFNQALKSERPAGVPVEPPPYVATIPFPLVGRTAEWERLLACWRRVTQGETHFALILGEPGVGKSRLADELFRTCAQYPEGTVARSRCYVTQGRLAYGPVAEWLRAEPMRQTRAQLPKPQLAELARVLPEVLVESPEIAPPKPLTESWQRRHLYDALNAGLGKSAKPLLLLIDDLQWCDQDTFEWLHAFFRSEEASQTLVLGTVRSEEAGRDHPLTSLVNELRRSEQLSEFPLEPLSVEDASALAVQVAGRDCEPAFLTGLYQATKGNPLFVVESVRASLEDQGSKGSTPARVQAVIGARFAQLSPQAYELAGLAATIARPFSFDLLAKATDWDEDSLSRALEELWQRRIIDGQSAGTYGYTHDLLREVAYSELSPIRQRTLHRRVARALEELHALDLDDVSGWLATHYAEAGMAETAIRYYRAAAAVARRRLAEAETADLIRRALHLCRDFPETAKRDAEELELLLTLGASLVTTYGYSTAEVGETYDRGLLLARRSGEGKHMFSLLGGAGLFHIVSGHLEEARRLGEDCLDRARREGDLPLETGGRLLLGICLFHLGQLEVSKEHIERVMPPPGQRPDTATALFAGPDVGVFCLAYLSHLLWHSGLPEQAVARSAESIAVARELAHPFTLAIALNYAAILDVFRRESAPALDRATEASALCRKYGIAYYLAWADIVMGWANAVEGNVADGLAQLRHGIDCLKATGAELRLPFYYGLLAEVCGLAGHDGDALANIANGFAFQHKNGEVWAASELHRIHGDVLLHAGDISGAEASYRRAIESARQMNMCGFEMRAEARLLELPTLESGARKLARNLI